MKIVRIPVVSLLLLLLISSFSHAADPATQKWWRGNIHGHSFHSDGNHFPEMVAKNYKDLGYQFISITDHNCLQDKPRHRPVNKVPASAVTTCKEAFGDIPTTEDGKNYILRTLPEIKKLVEEPGKFLLVSGQEINKKQYDKQIHANFLGGIAPLEPPKGDSAYNAFEKIIEVTQKQMEGSEKPSFLMLNHPYWPKYDIPAEWIASLLGFKHFEMLNISRGCKSTGDATHPSLERCWDAINVIRMVKHKAPPIFATATDDCHRYLPEDDKNRLPGRGWICVKSDTLSQDALLTAMDRGDYYTSNGVELTCVAYSPKEKTLRVVAKPMEGAKMWIEFVGTLKKDIKEDEPLLKWNLGDRPATKFSEKIGQVLKKVDGNEATYKLTGDELYVRAVVRSDQPTRLKVPDTPPNKTAWTQPFGWRK